MNILLVRNNEHLTPCLVQEPRSALRILVLRNNNKLKRMGGLVVSGNVRLSHTVFYVIDLCTSIVNLAGELMM